MPDELLTNRYTGPDGAAHFVVPPLTEGTLWVTVTDDEGNALTEPIPVTGTESAPPLGAAETLRLSAAPSVSRGVVRFAFGRALARGARLALFDVGGRKIRSLAVASGAESVTWDGADDRGAPARAGLYVASLDGAAGSVRVVIVR